MKYSFGLSIGIVRVNPRQFFAQNVLFTINTIFTNKCFFIISGHWGYQSPWAPGSQAALPSHPMVGWNLGTISSTNQKNSLLLLSISGVQCCMSSAPWWASHTHPPMCQCCMSLHPCLLGYCSISWHCAKIDWQSGNADLPLYLPLLWPYLAVRILLQQSAHHRSLGYILPTSQQLCYPHSSSTYSATYSGWVWNSSRGPSCCSLWSFKSKESIQNMVPFKQGGTFTFFIALCQSYLVLNFIFSSAHLASTLLIWSQLCLKKLYINLYLPIFTLFKIF